MSLVQTSTRIGKVCALIAATLIFPILAHAGTDNGNGNGGQNNGNQNGHNKVATVPDAGPGIVLLAATIGTIFVFSTRQLLRKRA
jgi:hypothetical protein